LSSGGFQCAVLAVMWCVLCCAWLQVAFSVLFLL
jgi:hypothetical protein